MVQRQASCTSKLKSFRSRLPAYSQGRRARYYSPKEALSTGTVERMGTWPEIVNPTKLEMALPTDLSTSHKWARRQKTRRVLKTSGAWEAGGNSPQQYWSPASSWRNAKWVCPTVGDQGNRLPFPNLGSLRLWSWSSSHESKGIRTAESLARASSYQWESQRSLWYKHIPWEHAQSRWESQSCLYPLNMTWMWTTEEDLLIDVSMLHYAQVQLRYDTQELTRKGKDVKEVARIRRGE